MNFTDSLENSPFSAKNNSLNQCLPGFVQTFPALLWRTEIAKWRIEFFNDFCIKGLDENTRLFLKNKSFRDRLILEEDLHKVDFFAEKMKSGIQAFVLFRIKVNDKISWLKLSGWVTPEDPLYYYGLFQDVTMAVDAARSMLENDVERLVSIDKTRHPAMLVDYDSQRILEINTPARNLFGYTTAEYKNLSFSQIHPRELTGSFQKLLEDILFERKWAGRLSFKRKGQTPLNALTNFHFLSLRGKGILRIVLTEIEKPTEVPFSSTGESKKKILAEFESNLFKRLNGKNKLNEILETFVEYQPPKCSFDGILFSDIHSKKNKVFVYGAGEPFLSMEPGEMFSYQGTIAQQIEFFKLDYLIVDETMDSIKAIDWALFIPKGIRSYFAKPFYIRGTLRSVMILCSCKPQNFSPDHLENYSALFRPFKKSIEAWRRMVRRNK
ncbi:PAS domain-containing protein [Desulfonatronovibrio hydrogenovorans]|uniref:PAS domain-containing protein n=1 Tax=Desulfonatronovibrio hydrogenovorans TaxID=53245 RepID=UPI00048D2063|nr:PAS domain-containing protein [Desulfonatronovibrio hydrogenovorans]